MSPILEWEVRNSLDLGRFVIAKRGYKINDLIFEEEPLLVSPIEALSTSVKNSVKGVKGSKFDCVGCCKTLFEEKYVCHNCFWPVCSLECSVDSLHTKYECSLFAEKKIGLSPKALEHIYIIRALLMYKDPTNRTPWEQFSSLSSSFGLNQEDFQAKITKDIEESTKYLNDTFQMNVDSNIIGQIIKICYVNSFGVEGRDENGNSYRAQAVYNRGSLFSHCCSPNGDWVIRPTDSNGIKRWDLRIYARRNILCDETISVSYITDCLILGTVARKKHIAQSFHFDCKCIRCNDSSEMGFYTEAVKCQFCCNEKLTADNPSDEFSNWTCNLCGGCNDYNFAKMCVESFKSSLKFAMDTPTRSSLEWLLLSSSNKRFGVSQNHRERIFAMFLWIQCLSEGLFKELIEHSDKSNAVFSLFMERATNCLKIFRMFGKLADVVEIESCFARAIAAYYFKTTDFCSIQYDTYLPEEKLKILTSICAHLKIAYDTMVINPSEGSGCVSLRQILITGFNFWKDQLEGMKNKSACNTNDSSNGFNEGGLINNVAKLKSSLNELKERPSEDSEATMEEEISKLVNGLEKLRKITEEREELARSVDFTSSGDSNLILTKPAVFLLAKLDFYFDC